MMLPRTFYYAPVGLLLLVLAACSSPPGPTLETAVSTTVPAAQIPASETSTPLLPSPTSEPLAASINGQPISVAQFKAESARYQSAVNRELTPEDIDLVLQDLIDQALLAQAARQNGLSTDTATVQARIDELAQQLGGQQALETWMSQYGYTRETFTEDLTRAIEAARMRDLIIGKVPETAEQVQARQILTDQLEEAQSVQARLQAGESFDRLAAEYDPIAEGNLGWFPRGYLLDSGLEEAVFSLEPGSYTPIVETPAGFHIVQLIDRDPDRPLEPDARRKLQARVLQDWLDQQRAQSDIEILAGAP